jgi:vitamin B12/bleomycin/antimicrobial peptide transport system ATP-binding/permease protein
MTEPVLSRVATARGFLNQLWKLSAPYWWSEEIGLDRSILGVRLRVREKWIARGLLFLIIGMAVFLVFLSKELNDWNARFYNALQEKNEAAFWAELWHWGQLVFVFIVIAVYRLWLRQLLSIRWRRWLTDVYFRQWLGERTYYHMELTGRGTDNPEQRIEQDINVFTQQTLTLVLGLLSEIMTLATFTVVLWNLSGPLVVPVFGGITIPGYMMWVAILYAAIGSWLTYKIGRPLVRVNFDLERYNADFRYRLIRVRENAESVALYNGEPDEERRLQGAFARIYDTWWDYMKYNKRLTWLTVFYSQAASIFPIIVAAPRYFSGEVPLGTLTQTAGAFGYVQGSLSWFVESYAILADWKAVVDRLTTFSEVMQRARVARVEQQGFDVADAEAASLALQNVAVALPDGRLLLEDVDLVIDPGQRMVIQGPSGSGKTTLFRVLAGLWPFGRGRIRVPDKAKALFLPQKPYIPIGTLKEALCYPDKPAAHDDQRATEALNACELAHFADRLHDTGNWAMVMSPGEQQRLAFARALLVRPDWLFLDEATSALDEATETAMYRLVTERLAGVTMVSIAHKPSVLRFHDRRLELDPDRRRVSLSALPEPAGG